MVVMSYWLSLYTFSPFSKDLFFVFYVHILSCCTRTCPPLWRCSRVRQLCRRHSLGMWNTHEYVLLNGRTNFGPSYRATISQCFDLLVNSGVNLVKLFKNTLVTVFWYYKLWFPQIKTQPSNTDNSPLLLLKGFSLGSSSSVSHHLLYTKWQIRKRRGSISVHNLTSTVSFGRWSKTLCFPGCGTLSGVWGSGSLLIVFLGNDECCTCGLIVEVPNVGLLQMLYSTTVLIKEVL